MLYAYHELAPSLQRSRIVHIKLFRDNWTLRTTALLNKWRNTYSLQIVRVSVDTVCRGEKFTDFRNVYEAFPHGDGRLLLDGYGGSVGGACQWRLDSGTRLLFGREVDTMTRNGRLAGQLCAEHNVSLSLNSSGLGFLSFHISRVHLEDKR